MKEDIVLRGIGKADNDLYLKAYLTWADVRVTKTHDLASILNLCIKNDKVFEKLDRDKISRLTLYAVEIGYPEEYIETDLEEVKEFYKLAKEVRELVVGRLNEKGLEIQNLLRYHEKDRYSRNRP